jgi:hypothetical protein
MREERGTESSYLGFTCYLFANQHPGSGVAIVIIFFPPTELHLQNCNGKLFLGNPLKCEALPVWFLCAK